MERGKSPLSHFAPPLLSRESILGEWDESRLVNLRPIPIAGCVVGRCDDDDDDLSLFAQRFSFVFFCELLRRCFCLFTRESYPTYLWVLSLRSGRDVIFATNIVQVFLKVK